MGNDARAEAVAKSIAAPSAGGPEHQAEKKWGMTGMILGTAAHSL